jgi:hypothetical protein
MEKRNRLSKRRVLYKSGFNYIGYFHIKVPIKKVSTIKNLCKSIESKHQNTKVIFCGWNNFINSLNN